MCLVGLLLFWLNQTCVLCFAPLPYAPTSASAERKGSRTPFIAATVLDRHCVQRHRRRQRRAQGGAHARARRAAAADGRRYFERVRLAAAREDGDNVLNAQGRRACGRHWYPPSSHLSRIIHVEGDAP